jgi:very-short-patch-repair endonuclease
MLHNRKYLKENRRALRSNLTPAEAELWKYIKNGQLFGRKFRRQHSIANFILDFYCPSERLAIELDGQVHYHLAAESADQERDLALQNLTIKVIRFENKDVFNHLDAVLLQISNCFSKKNSPP